MAQDVAKGAAPRNNFKDDLLYSAHCLNRNATAMAMLKYRNFQGFLITGPHSGTHWVKWMLSHAIAHHYKVAPPKYFNNASKHAHDIIGHPRIPRIHPQLPRIASTHSIAPYVLGWGWPRQVMRFPPYAVVLRDIRKVMISNYEKWQHRYQCSFSEYVHGDPRGDRFITDAWQYIRFMNRWGEVAQRFPAETRVFRYEDIRANPALALQGITRHFGLQLNDEDFAAAVAVGAKDVMARAHDPEVDAKALRHDTDVEASFTPEDTAVLQRLLDRHLHHDFGYNYFPAPRGFQGELVQNK